MRSVIKLKYDGAKIRSQQGMDAYDVAEAIDAFSDFIRSLSDAIFGEQPGLHLTINGFHEGSLDIQFIYDVTAFAATIISSTDGLTLGEAIGHTFKLLEHLRGQPPKTVKADHGGVAVENNDGQILVVNGPIYNVTVNGDLGAESERFAGKPLNRDADRIEVSVDGKRVADANHNSANSFVPLGKTEVVNEFVAELHLTIQTVVLEGDAAWRFTDGRNKFNARIADEDFLKQVRQGKERFGRGDILRVKLKTVQEKVKNQLRTNHTIEKVLSHQPFGDGQMALI
jgi:hypothetical protein